jgi:hypothetical protein
MQLRFRTTPTLKFTDLPDICVNATVSNTLLVRFAQHYTSPHTHTHTQYVGTLLEIAIIGLSHHAED